MRAPATALLLALLLQASQASADHGKEVCLASGASGSPLHRCLLDAKWNGEQSKNAKALRAWAEHWFPVGSAHVGWTASGEKQTTRVKSHDFDGDLGVPIVEFDAS